MTSRVSPIFTALLAGTMAVAAAPDASARQQASAGQRGTSSTRATARAATLGFSVVLVVGDLQAGGGEEDVPPAARRALADMKEFLPYKSYKLVDAAWIMGTSHAVSRLRGPDDREYEMEINVSDPRIGRITTGGTASTVPEGRISLVFSLREVAGSRDASSADVSATSRSAEEQLQGLLQQLQSLRAQLREAQAQKSSSHPDVLRNEREVARVQAKIEEVQRQSEQHRRSAPVARALARSVINTSFSMEVGETVVVGTSRLSGNSKALIALLTAVPAKSSRR